MKTRFAPSPTGLMHFGNVRTALFNVLFAKQQGGHFLLRIEDTDQARNKSEYVESLKFDLKWLGLDWDEGPYHQSERQAIYDRYYQQLESTNQAYPCFCTEQQLAVIRKVQNTAGHPPRYMGTCRNLSESERQEKMAQGLKPTLRFKSTKDEMIEFVDLIKGKQRFMSTDIGDFIIRRADGSASFMFCNAIDDAEMGVTHGLRGEDHLTNTPRQLMILKALNLKAPQYGHFPMILGLDGAPLSKRNGSATVQELREKGYLPLALINYLARLGHYYANNEFLTLKQLSEQFKTESINSAPAKHDPNHLKHWQKEAVLHLTAPEIWEWIAPHVPARTVPTDLQIPFAECIQANLLMPEEATLWAEAIFKQERTWDADQQTLLQEAGVAYFAEAVRKLQEGSPYEGVIQALTALGFKGKKLFMPLRVALTGQAHGPELPKMLQLMGHDRALDRLMGAHYLCERSG